MVPGTYVKVWLAASSRYVFAEVVDDATAEADGARVRPDRGYAYIRWLNEARNVSPVPTSFLERTTPLEVLGLA